MPIIKSAKKAARQAEKRTAHNVEIKKAIKAALKAFKKNPSAENLAKAQSEYDKAVKKDLMKKNTAARRKAKLHAMAKAENVKLSKKAAAKSDDEKRRILLRDFSENKVAFEKLSDYLDSPHRIALFETKLDKRSAAYKTIKGKVDIQEFTLPQNQDFRLVFDIYRTAKKDGKKAIELLEKIKINEDPIQFAGLLNSQAINDYASKQGTKERRTLKELSKLDIDLKSSKLSSWSLIESFLLRLSSWWS